MVFVLISLIVVYPDVKKNQVNDTKNTNEFPILVVQCTLPHKIIVAIQLLYISALITASNALALLTIQYPQNFNESKYVAFSTFALVLIWLAFIISYVIVNAQFRPVMLLLAIQLSALAILLCLFCPRVVIMIARPSRNAKSASTADKSVSLSLAKTTLTTTELPTLPE